MKLLEAGLAFNVWRPSGISLIIDNMLPAHDV